METMTRAEAGAVSPSNGHTHRQFAGIRSAVNAEVERRVRRRLWPYLAFGLIAGVLLALLITGDAFAAADPVNHATKTMKTWLSGAFGVICAFAAVRAVMRNKIVEFGVFAVMAMLAVPFIVAPQTVETLGKNITQTIFGTW